MTLAIKILVIFSIIHVTYFFDLAIPTAIILYGAAALFSQIGGSGKYRNYYIPSKNRKEAEEKARRNGGGNPPIDDGDHFHSRNGKGEKIGRSHYGYKGKGKKKIERI